MPAVSIGAAVHCTAVVAVNVPSEATTAAAHPGSTASAARPPPSVPTTPATALAVNRLQPVVITVGNFESKLLSAESVGEFLKTILRSVSPPAVGAEVHPRLANEQPVVPGHGAVVPTPRAVSPHQEPSALATSESNPAVTPAGHAEASKDQDVTRRSTRFFNATEVATAAPGRTWGPRERRPSSSDAAMPPDDEDPPFGRGAAKSGEMAAAPNRSHPTAVPPGDEAADGATHRPPVAAAKPKRDTAAADETTTRQFKVSTSTASVVHTVNAAGETQHTTPAGRAASSSETSGDFGRHESTVNGLMTSASVANSWDHGNKTEETRSDASNPTASTIGMKQLLFDSYRALSSTSRPSVMSSPASTLKPSTSIFATTQSPQKSPAISFLKTNPENGSDSSPPVRETRIEISDLADEVTTGRRPKSATMPNLAPSESFKPDRKAIVITFPNKLKNIQPGFKMDIKPGEDDSPARIEQTIAPSTSYFSPHRHTTLQPYETDKNRTAYRVTVTATPLSHTSTTHLAEATGAIKPFQGKQTGLMDSYIDTNNDNHTYIHISVLVTYFNDSRPLASETLSVNFKPKLGNSTDYAANNLKTMSEAIVSGLTKMPILKRVLQGSDLAVDRGIGPVTEPITTESHTSQAVSKSSYEYYRFSTGVDDTLSRTTTARSISTSETSQNHVERRPTWDSKPETSSAAPTRIAAEGNTIVLYSETGDCSPEIADKISELEDYWKSDTEKVVVEMICRPAPVSISDTAYKGSRGKRSTLTETNAFKSRLSLAEGDSTALDKNAEPHSKQNVKPSKRGVMKSSRTVVGSTSITATTPPSADEALDIESRFDPGNKDIPVAAPFIKISEGDQLQHRKDAPDSDDPHKTSEGEQFIIRKYSAENDKNVQHGNHADAKIHFERHSSGKPPETPKKSLARSNSHDSRTTKPPHDHDESAHRSAKQSSRPLDDTITTEISQRRTPTSAKRKKMRVMTPRRKKTTERSFSLDNATLADFEASERLDKNETEIEGDLSMTDQQPQAFSASKYGPGAMKLEPTEGELRSVQMPPDTTSLTSPPTEHFRASNYVSLSTATRNVPWVLHKLLSILEKLEEENMTKNSKGTTELPQDITHPSSEPSTLTPQNNETTAPMHLSTVIGENFAGETKPVLDYPHGRVFVPSELPWPTMENTESSTRSSTEKSHTPSTSQDFTISSSTVTKAPFFTVVEKRTVSEASTSVSPILSIMSLPPEVTTKKSIKSHSSNRKYQARGQSRQGLPLEFDGDSTFTERTLNRAKVSRISARNLGISAQSYDKLDTCDSLCKPKPRTVCAQVGSITRTFNSLCDVKIEGCIVGEATKIRHTGPCNRFKKRKTKVIIEQEDEIVADDEIEDTTKASQLPIVSNKNATLAARNEAAAEAAATTATSQPVKRTNKVDFIE
ncbi:hypothetical protein ONE63_002255 [Megalurothrips usitatus]|uniref:Uncharacterized protein n=1 Tax=Megalurothrips usitatus TaxID=439358 RepID=A0AAV7X7L0_9NEOP|nr:hypothetical protein ONE63_002255 [Megalurothrips usitatus]